MPLPAVATANGGTERYTRTPTQQRATLPNARAVQALKPGRKSRLGENPGQAFVVDSKFRLPSAGHPLQDQGYKPRKVTDIDRKSTRRTPVTVKSRMPSPA